MDPSTSLMTNTTRSLTMLRGLMFLSFVTPSQVCTPQPVLPSVRAAQDFCVSHPYFG